MGLVSGGAEALYLVNRGCRMGAKDFAMDTLPALNGSADRIVIDPARAGKRQCGPTPARGGAVALI